MTFIDPDRERLSSGETTMRRREVTTAAVGSTNGNLRLTYFTARKTETIGQVRTTCGATAGVGATLCRVGVYEEAANGDLTLVASIANDTTLWVAASTGYVSTFSASFLKRRGVRYAVGQLVVGASTAPTWQGQATLLAAEVALTPRLCGVVSGQTDLPSSVAVGSVSNSANQVYSALVP